MAPIKDLQNKKLRYVLGLMSGTSCDGLDIVRIRISGKELGTNFELINKACFSYTARQKQFLLHFLEQPTVSLKDISQLNFYLPRLWNAMIQDFLDQFGLHKKDVDLIGSHGQTIWHEPNPSLYEDQIIASTLQLGDPSVLAQLSGIPVVGDFRVADVALGGQGAPLIPYFDWLHFSRFRRNILIINIGGIANLSFISAQPDFDKIRAFDCGPGNMLIDAAAKHYFQKPFDHSGEIAARGNLNREFMDFLIDIDPFINQPPPKSTGRELFGQAFFNRIISQSAQLNIPSADILRTLTEYTAFSIFQHYQKYVLADVAAELVLVGGGGAQNSFLISRLKSYFKDCALENVRAYGVDPDFKEAIGFAVLANETINGIGSNVPITTGACRRTMLGKICPA